MFENINWASDNFLYLYLYKYENVCLFVCLSVCLFAHVFLGRFETDLDTLGTKFLLGVTRSPSGTRGRSLGRRQGRSLGRSRGVSWRRSRSRSRSRGVGERFKPIVDLIDTIKLARLHRAVAKRTKYAKGVSSVRQKRKTQQSCYLVRRIRTPNLTLSIWRRHTNQLSHSAL